MHMSKYGMELSKSSAHLMQVAENEARAWNDKMIEPHHILVACARLDDSVASKVLTQSGLELNTLRTEVLRLLGRVYGES